jgi:hypothetical protein
MSSKRRRVPAIVREIFDAKVSAADMESALKAINAMPGEDRIDITARTICLIKLFDHRRDQTDVATLISAIDFRFEALAKLSRRPEFGCWSMPRRDGSNSVAITVLEAAATEPLIELQKRPAFDADSFFKRLLVITEAEGRG